MIVISAATYCKTVVPIDKLGHRNILNIWRLEIEVFLLLMANLPVCLSFSAVSMLWSLEPQCLYQGIWPLRCHLETISKAEVSALFYVLLTVRLCIIFFKWSQLGAHYFLVYLFQLPYMFRATMCPSLEELTVSVRHWYFSLCMGSVWSAGCVETSLIPTSRPDSHPHRVKNISVA